MTNARFLHCRRQFQLPHDHLDLEVHCASYTSEPNLLQLCPNAEHKIEYGRRQSLISTHFLVTRRDRLHWKAVLPSSEYLWDLSFLSQFPVPVSQSIGSTSVSLLLYCSSNTHTKVPYIFLLCAK